MNKGIQIKINLIFQIQGLLNQMVNMYLDWQENA